jgi:putative CocE/NonD family hydrolase
LAARDLVRAFFDEHLKGEGRFEHARVKLFLTGSNEWIEGDDYPLPQVQTRSLHLRSGGAANGLRGDGRLTWEVPAGEPPDRYVHDPLDPVPSELPDENGLPRTLREWPRDLAPLLARPDMLVYQSAPLTEALRVAGDVNVRLHVSTDALDADFFCRLEDVSPDGRGMRLGSHGAGRQRLGAREGIDRDVPVIPDEVIEIRVALLGIGHTFLSGHRLRLSICSSAYPEAFPNPGNGQPVTTNLEPPRRARQCVWHDTEHPSRLELPVLP